MYSSVFGTLRDTNIKGKKLLALKFFANFKNIHEKNMHYLANG